MINGIVTASRNAVIRLIVRGPTGHSERIRALVDTGYNGWLTLPSELIERLALPWRRISFATLADGSETAFDIYEGAVVWDRRPRRIPVDESECITLVGMALLEGYELNVQVRRAGKVTIRSLSQ
jgi:clan AA aspartic protease